MSAAEQESERRGGPDSEPRSNIGRSSDEAELSFEELLYSSSSFHAIIKPVTVTMVLTALAVIYVNDEDFAEQTSNALSSAYTAFDNTSEENTTAQTLGISLVNALIIVSAIGLMTFGIVLLYKYRCMKCLLGYMMLSSGVLLGLLGFEMLALAIEVYRIPIDKISFYLALFNFAAVGVFAIFWPHGGVPSYVTQGYLIATSVILAWQLSFFDPWTSWTLLVMLALYDLCAVLTPCGPLKALVNLMSQEGSPSMPGLLYEAQLPAEARRPGNRHGQQTSPRQTEEGATSNEAPSNSSTDAPVQTDTRSTDDHAESNAAMPAGEVVMTELESGEGMETSFEAQSTDRERVFGAVPTNDNVPPPSARIPFAIAKLYRLQIVESIQPARRRSFTPLLNANGDPQDGGHESDPPRSSYTSEQLQQEVEAFFPRGGGCIERILNRNGEVRYAVKDRHGELKRVVFVNNDGRVFEERENEVDHEDGGKGNTIKLGLGDFIFYSVLVANAVLHSFTTFIACTLVILAGLGGTLVLLAVFRHALPALPISIFLGVVFYLLTRLAIEPYIQEVLRLPFYV